jgi:transposase
LAKALGVDKKEIKGDVGHRKAISKGGDNGLANLFVQSPSTNRSFARNPDSSMKDEKSKRERNKK